MLVDQSRVATVVFGKSRPRDRDEEEVRGYRNALNLIHERVSQLPVSEEVILRLHRLSLADMGDAGQYKEKDSDIIEKYADGRIRALQNGRRKAGSVIHARAGRAMALLSARTMGTSPGLSGGDEPGFPVCSSVQGWQPSRVALASVAPIISPRLRGRAIYKSGSDSLNRIKNATTRLLRRARCAGTKAGTTLALHQLCPVHLQVCLP